MKIPKTEKFSAYSHAAAVPVMIAGTIILAITSRGNSSILTVSLIYGISAIALFSASFLYHSKKTKENEESLWRKLDHSAIFILIAGTYTPMCYLYLDGPMMWGILIAQWSLVVSGISFKFLFIRAPRFLTTLIYLLMGWIVVIPFGTLIEAMPSPVFGFLLAGGIAYTIGAVIYIVKKPDPVPGIFGFHEIFHILIVTGALFHLIMVIEGVSIVQG